MNIHDLYDTKRLMKILSIGHCKFDLEKRNQDGKTVLYRSLEDNDFELAQILVDKGVDTTYIDFTAMLNTFLISEDEAQQQLILFCVKNGADLNQRDSDGWNALHRAVIFPKISLEIISEMIDRGARMDWDDYSRRVTPLMTAIEEGRADLVKLMIEKGVDVNQKTWVDNCTPLSFVLDWPMAQEIVPLLLKYGANKDAKDRDGLTAYDIALHKNIESLLPILKPDHN